MLADGLFSSITLIILIIALFLQRQYFGQSSHLNFCNDVDTERLTPSGSSTFCSAWLSHSLTQASLPIEGCKRLLSVFAGPVFIDSEPLRGIPKLQLLDDVAAATGMSSLNCSSFFCCIYPFGLAVASVGRRWRCKEVLNTFTLLLLENSWSMGIT